MDALRIKITALTSSFRYPTFISGVQRSLPAPPLSTIYGLLSAAKGRWVTPVDTDIGYIYSKEGKAIDLETIHVFNDKGQYGGSNVIRREFHYKPKLYLYLTNVEFEKYFFIPHFPLMLGRSSDLISVDRIEKVELEKVKEVKISGSLLPFKPDELTGVNGPIFPLPVFFRDTIPRQAAIIEIFCLQENEQAIQGDNLFLDSELNQGVYIHNYKDTLNDTC